MTSGPGAAGARDRPVLAVDGGGVKTDVALVDASGALLSLVRGGGSQVHYLGVDGCLKVLQSLLERATAEAGLGRPRRGFASTAQILLAGADLPEERSILQSRIGLLNWSDRLVVDNDTVALLRAGTDRGWGVAVVCGAGINCLGRAPDGREVRFPSLGRISGDWGGGADVGLEALAAAARSADRRGPKTVLEAAVPAHFGCRGPLEVARLLHLREMPMIRLGELAPIVVSLSGEDPVAAGIVRRVAEEVIAFARAALGRLELSQADPDVVLGGGVLRAVPASVVDEIARGVQEVAPNAHVIVATNEPIAGAVLLGLDALGSARSVQAHARAGLDAVLPAIAAPLSSDLPPSSARQPAPR